MPPAPTTRSRGRADPARYRPVRKLRWSGSALDEVIVAHRTRERWHGRYDSQVQGGSGPPRVVLVAPQTFKGTHDAATVAAAIARGIRRVWSDAKCRELPLADGGEGTVRALVAATGGQYAVARVHDPLGRPIDATWGRLGDGTTAVIEMAAASGLSLLQQGERDPLQTSSRGTGELILAAAASGAHRIIVGLGDSATNDGGAGMARAFGYLLRDRRGRDIAEGGAALGELHHLEGQTDPRLVRSRLEAACDVWNPLLGSNGATATFATQKGAGPADLVILERALTRYAEVLEAFVGRPLRDVPGAGAAGGLGVGLLAFLDAQLRSGAELVLDALHFTEALRACDLVVTGEGRVDGQTVQGKVVGVVAAAARAAGVPVAAVAGSAGAGHEALGLAVLEIAASRPGATARLSDIEDAASRLAERLQSEVASVGPVRRPLWS
ncbi:MAG: glycerate kinase [Chloroflexi bacterium]|nr:glycerate kinase [Chloroflexota bacterium]